jgi:hypothetical protein
VCEIDLWYLEGFGFTVGELTGFFQDRGYSLYRYDRSSSPARLRNTGLHDVGGDNNYVFVHPRWRERLSTLIDPA